jgi:transposase InsO family protein
MDVTVPSGRVDVAEPNQIWQSDMTKIWAGPAVSWAYLVCVIDCFTREVVGWNSRTVAKPKMRWQGWSKLYSNGCPRAAATLA